MYSVICHDPFSVFKGQWHSNLKKQNNCNQYNPVTAYHYIIQWLTLCACMYVCVYVCVEWSSHVRDTRVGPMTVLESPPLFSSPLWKIVINH